ncbi:cortactin-binding protein 2 [Leptonychotes weddellii]|uniref:Cortactin-binding protein 2 n=1 Tax=Leptonychotes weddellii TaxID=9713 RepID=A0A7F8QD25_LEPWE|nr:cortactin-binding protein 2 [Leptonychotes weddellii]
MATDGASCEPDFSRAPEDAAGATAEAAKKEFDVDTLSKSELRMLLSVMEGELEARDLVIEALRARRKEVFIQERYGRFNLNDPFLALQRDYEAGAGDKEKKPVCTNPLSILEAVMAHCRKMQERMSTQLAAAESRQKKLETEKLQLQALEQEHKQLEARLEEERGKNKHVVLMLVKECKQLSGKVLEEAQKLEDVMAKLEEEKKKTSALEEELSTEKQRSTEMEAQMEKQLSEFDTEREQLRAKLHREEAHTTDLKEEIDKMKKMIEQLKRGNDSKPSLSLPRKTKDRRLVSISVGTEGPVTRSVACQTDLPIESTDHVKKLPLTMPVKPPTGSPLVSANTKGNVCTSAALGRPGTDRQPSHGDLTGSSLPTVPPPSANRVEENGPSTGSPSSTTPLPNSTAPPPMQTPGIAPQSYSQAPPTHSLHSPCANAALHPGLNPRIQAARFRFQGNANDPDQNGNTTQSPPSRDVSPTSRDNLVAKQLARNTVTQALSRFTSPQAGAPPRPGVPPTGDVGTCAPVSRTSLKTPGVARVDRGNPPPIPPKKPGLSQTPSPPHPQLKVIMDSSRASNAGAKGDNKTMASPPSTLPQGNRVINEENLPKSSSPQLPPKPSIDLTVAPAGCAVSALATSQVGAWPAETPGLNQPACSESSLVIPTTIAFCSSINPVSASSCRTGASDSLLVTASGWSPSLTPLLMSGGPAPLAGRPTLLQQAAAQGNVTLLSMLLNEEGLDINYSCEDGHSALYSAAKNGHTDCVRLLLNAEAQVNAADKNGFTPLCAAAAQGHFKCVELLIAYNANINHAADEGQTPLYLACKNGNKECIKHLLEAGTDRSVKTRDGWTPVHAAVDTGNVDSLKLLMYHRAPARGNSSHEEEPESGVFDLDQGEESPEGTSKPVVPADLINHADGEGWTAAHIAASKGFKVCLCEQKEFLSETGLCHVTFDMSACLIPVKQSPVNKKVIIILENLEKSSLSELLGDFLAPLENRSTESPWTLQKGNGPSECYYFHENCFLMGTVTKACLQGADLLVQQHFRWVQLRWDSEPMQGLLRRFLQRKAVSKFRGQVPSPCDPVCKTVDWALAVWRQLNSCLARLGTPEALLGPKYFLSCPVVPGHAQATVKWMAKLWNAIIAPRVQEAILSRASVRRQPGLGLTTARNHPSQGQQAVVKAALSILLNKAVLHGCPLQRAELDQHTADFKGGGFPLSIVSSYNSCSKKKGESGAWRKVSTSPRKKSGRFSPPSWSKPGLSEEGIKIKAVSQLNYNRNASLSKQKSLENDLSLTLNLEQRLSLGSDDEADLVKELQSMCSSKSESDISKIADSRDDLRRFDSSGNNPAFSATVNPRMPVSPKGVSPLSSHQPAECSNSPSKTELGVSRVKSFLPVPRSKVTQCSQNTKSSSRNTRQIEINNNSKEEI